MAPLLGWMIRRILLDYTNLAYYNEPRNASITHSLKYIFFPHFFHFFESKFCQKIAPVPLDERKMRSWSNDSRHEWVDGRKWSDYNAIIKYNAKLIQIVNYVIHSLLWLTTSLETKQIASSRQKLRRLIFRFILLLLFFLFDDVSIVVRVLAS